MSGPYNNEPLFPPKPVSSNSPQSSSGNTQTGFRNNQGNNGPGKVCNVKTKSLEDMRNHIKGHKQKDNAEKQKQNDSKEQGDSNSDKSTPTQPNNEGKKGNFGRTREGFEKSWRCEVCNVATTCSENLEAHFKGQKHKNNLAKLGLQGKGDMSASGSSNAPPRKMNVAEEILKNSHPLIGVECMTEYIHIDPVQDPHYECNVCEFMLMPGNVIPHIMGYKHRVKYVQKFYPDIFNESILPTANKHNLLTNTGDFNEEEQKKAKGTLSCRARDVAIELEKRDGRKTMKSVVVRGQRIPSQLRIGQIHFSEIARMQALGGMHDWSFKAVDEGWNFSEAAVNWGMQRGGPIGMPHGPGPMGPDGPGPRGMGPDGPGPMGMGPDGHGPMGMGPGGPGPRDMGPGGPGPRGMGHGGPGPRGMGPDGPDPMGMGPDGPGPRGMGFDGPGPRGMGPDGSGQRGMGPDGPGPMGMGPDGPGPMGMGSDGPGPMGMGRDGPGPMGMGPNGPGRMGMGPDGPGNLGMRHDGPGPMGMGPDGPNHMRGPMGMGHDGPGPMGMRDMGPEAGGAGWTGPRGAGPGQQAQPFFSEADINPEMLSDEFIKREYERRFGGKKRNSDQPPLPSSPPSKKPRPPPPPGGDSDNGSSEKMQTLFNELSTSMIKNEEDASMALQVSNTLTKALLNYRLKSLPEGVSLLG